MSKNLKKNMLLILLKDSLTELKYLLKICYCKSIKKLGNFRSTAFPQLLNIFFSQLVRTIFGTKYHGYKTGLVFIELYFYEVFPML